MALSPPPTRRCVTTFVVVAVVLSVLAAVLILRGWDDESLQEQVREIEAAEEAEGNL